MDPTHQEKETLTSERIRKLETMNIIPVEVKCLKTQLRDYLKPATR